MRAPYKLPAVCKFHLMVIKLTKVLQVSSLRSNSFNFRFMVWDLDQCSKRLSIKVVVWLARDCKNLRESASPRSDPIDQYTYLHNESKPWQSHGGERVAIIPEMRKFETGLWSKSDGSIYNRTRVTWTCWSLMVNAEEMKTALVTQSVCQPFIKITQVFLKQLRCTVLTRE